MMRLAVLAAAPLLAACGSPAPSQIPIAGPWQAEPFAPIDARLANAAEIACRDMGSVKPGQAQVVLHDQRGEGIDTVLLAGPTMLAECDGVLRESGLFTLTGGSSEPLLKPSPGDLSVVDDLDTGMSGSGVLTRTMIAGRAGAGVAKVVVVLDDGRAVTASLGNGFFTAWWPGSGPAASIVVFGPDGSPVATLNP